MRYTKRNIEDHIREVLTRAHKGPFKLQSDFARAAAYPVAVAASCGLISCYTLDDRPVDRWHVTLKGLKYLHGELEDGI